MRYTESVSAPNDFATPRTRPARRRCPSGPRKLQSLLGDHQDSVVSREHLAQQAEAAHAAGEDTFTYGLLYQREADLALQCRRQLEPTLRKLYKAVRKLSG